MRFGIYYHIFGQWPDRKVMTTETSIYEYAKQGFRTSPNRIALWFYGKSISFKELFEKIDNVAAHLHNKGVKKGTVVTIHLPNCPQAVIALYAIAKLGGICDMVHALTPVEAVKKSMLNTNSEFLITHNSDFTTAGHNIFFVDIAYHMGIVSQIGYHLKNKSKKRRNTNGFEVLETSLNQQIKYPEAVSLAEECAVYLHSSGSTGKPKTILLNHSALNNCVANTADFFENSDMSEQVSLGVLPLFHGFGLAMDVHRNISFGSQLVLMARWNVKLAVKLIKKYKVSLMVGVPTMYQAMLNEPQFRGEGISYLSRCYVGGDNVKPELIKEFNQRVGKERCMFVGFGLTEATTTNCVNTYLHYKDGTSGYPVRNTSIAVIDENGKMSSKGEGELVISSKTLMMGYLDDPMATQHMFFVKDGKKWTHTGDHVRIDEDGFLIFKSRIKNIIIHNGYNIYPEQIEEVIRQVPNVKDVCVVGVLDEKTHTQIIKAVVIKELNMEPKAMETEIRRECMRILPKYSVPQIIVFTSKFPQNNMGKIDRRSLSQI